MWSAPVRRSLTSTTNSPYLQISHDTLHHQPTGVLVVRWNRPDQLNPFSVSMGESFEKLMTSLQNESTSTPVRALVLTGNGRAFSAGGDLAFLEERTRLENWENVRDMRQFYSRFLSIRKVPIPTIAALNGHAVGAACCLSLACDIRIASSQAKLGFNFTRLGISPGMGGSYYLPRWVGMQSASRLLLSGELIEAEEAYRLGLVGELTENGETCVERAVNLARTLALQCSPVAIRETIRLLRQKQDEGLEAALQAEAEAQARCYATPEFRQGLDSIRNKKPASFPLQ